MFNWDKTVILHNMGKVGSSTVWNSLKVSGIDQEKTLLRSHFTSKKGVQLFRKVHEDGYGG
jgi:hypothetical protein